jgi:BlaI family transcriptional regulator, penicillinase repressor
MNPMQLSRRERQIMDALFKLGTGTAADIRDVLPDPPSYSAVRTHLRILEEKGHVIHQEDGQRYVYEPVMSPDKARQHALRHVLSTFFHDSPAQAVAALLDEVDLSNEEYERLSRLIDKARDQGR